MIGSSTYIIKYKNRYTVHIGAGFIPYGLKKFRTNKEFYHYCNKYISKWENPDAIDLTQEQIDKIVKASSVRENPLAGDTYLLLDQDSEEIKYWRGQCFICPITEINHDR